MDKKNIREIVIASAMYSLGSILGPILVIGGIGWILDRVFNTKPWLLLVSILIAFFVTNVLLFRKIKKINIMMEAYQHEALISKENDRKDNLNVKNN